jgi:hypothetical protein
MVRRILIEVDVEETDSIEPGYVFDPKMSYELTPVDSELEGSIEFVCRRSQLNLRLSRIDKRHQVNTNTSVSGKTIYGEPEEEVGHLVRDATHKLLTGFNIPALDAIIDSIEEAVMPNTVRKRKKAIQDSNLIKPKEEG